ncbi:hypothetical protein J7T55_015796 [Diaporthe amygdali]|uniref:uncharacterized protein n=1 Tax=Phomopsis amygdali TaxID=1214568 RepID=UPI0022FF4573|nr:uncharacterized protein J7T55_015796 [Diaporthe amygdali]KAJ0107330.1 hypothetical protein J7T55_015796 [Diaporthe amygdali]
MQTSFFLALITLAVSATAQFAGPCTNAACGESSEVCGQGLLSCFVNDLPARMRRLKFICGDTDGNTKRSYETTRIVMATQKNLVDYVFQDRRGIKRNRKAEFAILGTVV